jgi:predicted transglutaminase-like cysteine proteinase
MQFGCTRFFGAGLVMAAALAAMPAAAVETVEPANEQPLFVAIGASARAPIGWIEFCAEYSRECNTKRLEARDVVLTPASWNDLVRINKQVNDSIKPMTDIEHWGLVERWSYPDDGYGDCEDYVLLKRKLLMQAGWPRQALLITVVRDTKGEGHAVLTVKTDKGELILDNQEEQVLLWSQTGYRFVKRQSQQDPNTWVSLGDPRPALSTTASRGN